MIRGNFEGWVFQRGFWRDRRGFGWARSALERVQREVYGVGRYGDGCFCVGGAVKEVVRSFIARIEMLAIKFYFLKRGKP